MTLPPPAPDPRSAVDHQAGRLLRALSAPGAALRPEGDGYVVRILADRRRRPRLRCTEPVFRLLTSLNAISPGPDACFVLSLAGKRLAEVRDVAPKARPPAASDGKRPDRLEAARCTAPSAVAWLAGRRDAHGQSLLDPSQIAAAAQLAADHEASTVGAGLTMRWDAGPRGSGANRGAPPLLAMAARTRVMAAIVAVGPELAALVTLIILDNRGLEASEKSLRLRRSSARKLLAIGLSRLARHYAGQRPIREV